MGGIRQLEGKHVVITGAGSGIGRATALAFAKRGSRVVVCDIDSERADTVTQEILDSGGDALARSIDVADKEAMRTFAEEIMATLGHVDVFYANAGVGIGGRALDATLQDWEWLVGINWWGVLYGMHFFVPHMVERGSGHFVITSSTAGLVPIPGLVAYTSMKHAVMALGQSMRAELRASNVGVTTICPGFIKTNLVRGGRFQERERFTREETTALLDRFGRSPEAVARAVISGVRRNRGIVPVGVEAWFGWYLNRFSVRLMELFLRPLANRVQ